MVAWVSTGHTNAILRRDPILVRAVSLAMWLIAFRQAPPLLAQPSNDDQNRGSAAGMTSCGPTRRVAYAPFYLSIIEPQSPHSQGAIFDCGHHLCGNTKESSLAAGFRLRELNTILDSASISIEQLAALTYITINDKQTLPIYKRKSIIGPSKRHVCPFSDQQICFWFTATTGKAVSARRSVWV